ncbi:MAG: hypothetical protein HYS13_00745 [Planctomycetia bacterium]|nr:hypothetical protein [Planctomycetia bacterium]
MKARGLVRSAIAFAAVVAAYWTYALAVVPIIDPRPTVIATPGDVDQPPIAKGDRPVDESMQRWFPDPRAWELDGPKRLVTQDGILLFKDYKTLADGPLKIYPCTLVLVQTDQPASPQRDRQAVILQAPQGAILKFNQRFDPVRSKAGKLQSGLLVGRITIRSQGKTDGPDDDLFVNTYDVDLTATTISTPQPVQFRYGQSAGSGREMQIELSQAGGKNKSNPLAGAAIETFALKHDVVMDLVVDNRFEEGRDEAAPPPPQPSPDHRHPAGGARGEGGTPAAARTGKMPVAPGTGKMPVAPGAPGSEKPATPVKIACRGPFQFDFVDRVATFEDHVDVLRVNPGAESDQLRCNTLKVWFEPAQKDDKKTAGKPGRLPKLKAQRVEAVGNPVVLMAPSSAAYAECQKLEYNLATGRVSLEAKQESMVRYEANEIHSREIHYQPGEEGRAGQFLADGEGWLVWHIEPEKEGDPLRRFEASWARQLHSRPHEGRQVISLEGGAKAGVSDMGFLKADEIHAWLFEDLVTANAPDAPRSSAGRPGPASKLRSKLTPDRLLALGNVQVESPQLTGKTQRLESWFRTPPSASGNVAQPSRSQPRVASEVAGKRPPEFADQPGFERRTDVRPAGPDDDFPPLPPEKRVQKFNVTGDLVQADVVLAKPAEVSELRITGAARLTETHAPDAKDRPVVITGDVVHALRANMPDTLVTVTGKPSHVEGRGLALDGAEVNFDRAVGRVWIDGPGTMTLKLDRDLNGKPTAEAKPLVIRWNEKMNFDGLTAVFDGEIVAQREHEKLATERLEVTLTRRVDFGNPKSTERPQVEKIVCREGVVLEREVHDERGLAAQEWMKLRDLVINQTSGAIVGGGPGAIRHVGRGGQQSSFFPAGGAAPRGGAGGAAGANDDTLTYLYVTFQGGMTGNTIRREISFNQNVQAIYGPVADWNDEVDPDRGLGENGAILNADEMTVQELKQDGGPPSLEFQAIGNAVVEGETFLAKGNRVAYSRGKDLLILEGTLRDPAQLWRQAQVGGNQAYTAARKIEYWRREPRITITGGQILDINQQPMRPKPKAPPRAR